MINPLDRRRFLTTASVALAASRSIPAANAAGSVHPYSLAHELLASLAARKISARELLDAQIARIEAVDPKINAVIVRDFDRAREAAKDADAALAHGDQRRLLGLPMTVKEQFNVSGLATTWGTERFRDWRPNFDTLVVQRLKAAGAIIIGKTNVPENLADFQSYNPVYGTTNNPWDLGRTPGGSSGGAAAALAAGFVPLELGSDIGGSLRNPAHYCGVLSHKPSLDLVPQRGSGPPHATPNSARGDMAVIGPMARSAADLALELQVLAGPDENWDGVGYKLALPPPQHDKIADYRVLVLDGHPLCPTADNIRAAIGQLADRLGQIGVTILRKHPDMPNLARTTRNYYELLAAFMESDAPPDRRSRFQTIAAALSPDDLSLRAAWLRGSTMTHAAWVTTSYIREGLRGRWQRLFEDIDLVLCPVMPTVAFLHDHSSRENRTVTIDGKAVDYDDQVVWAAVATSMGFPATIAPIGRSADGLPIGVQIIGAYLNDLTTIAFAGHIEQEFGGFAPPPGL